MKKCWCTKMFDSVSRWHLLPLIAQRTPWHDRIVALLRAYDVQWREEVWAEQLMCRWKRRARHNNAYTDYDVTVSGLVTPALELIFDLEADRIRYLAFDPKIIESERGVVGFRTAFSVDANNFGLLDKM
ncbi:MAG: hypothetical protein U0Y68_14345 [Blastocatellia bacterium]